MCLGKLVNVSNQSCKCIWIVKEHIDCKIQHHLTSLSNRKINNQTEEKDTLGKFISYQLKGVDIPDPVPRRYREFDVLRSKLVDRWPGFYIPPLPRKKAIGNKSQDTVDTRYFQLNRFCKLVGKHELLYTSPETQAFISNTHNVEKAMGQVEKESMQQMLSRYKEKFPVPSVKIFYFYNI